MDFVSFIRDQSDKLNSRDYVQSLWSEIDENNQESDTVTPEAVSDFNNHLPVLLDQFWESALEKISDQDSLSDEIDEELKVYIIVLVYQCTTQSPENVSLNCVINACEVYLCLLVGSQSDAFFKSRLYNSVLTTLQNSLDNPSAQNLGLIVKLKNFLKKGRLKTTDLEITVATLIQVVFIKTRKVLSSFETDDDGDTLSFQSLLCLKVLLLNESASARKFLIITFLLNGLRKYNSIHMTPQSFNIIQTNFRRLFKDKSVYRKLKDDDHQTFLNAFIHVWKHPDFAYFTEAVLIMNGLKERHYRNLIDILNKMLMSKNPYKSLFKFALAIICNPPKHADLEKTKIANEILLRNILTNFMAEKSEISGCAIEAFAEILLSPDLEKDYVKNPMKAIFNCPPDDSVLDVPTILKGLRSLVNKKWSQKSRNKHLFAVTLYVILMCKDEHAGLYQEVLELLTEQASPFDLRPFVQLTSETYLKACSRNFNNTAFQLLKIIFKMAIHPMASSTEFVKLLYTAMVFPSVCKGVAIKSEHFIDPIISSDFNYVEFFQKCHTMGLIKKDHVVKLIGNLYSINESYMRLACAIVHLTEYNELSVILDHINDNFLTVCNSKNLTYLLYIYNKILKNNTSAGLHQTLRNNEIMVCFLKQHLANQSLRWNSVSNAFALLKSLEGCTDLNEDFIKLKEEYDKKLHLSLINRGNFLPMLYFSQLVIFSRQIPSDQNIESITNFLRLCANDLHGRSPEFNPKLWIGCLLLYTNICVVKTNLVETGLNFIQNGLNSPVTAVKLAAVDMMFDLCNMVTHNFEDLIRYMFKQLVYGDTIFKKTCLVKIDKLIRDDYLKLELVQFLIFVCILGDRTHGLGDYLQQLLAEHFLISNATVIAKNFVPLIVHINGYRRHPVYKLAAKDYSLLEVIKLNKLDRRKIYTLLFTNLPVKARFNIIHAVSANILDEIMRGKIKMGDGFWNMTKDSVFVFKLMSSNANDEDSCENYYKKVSAKITKFIIGHAEYADKRNYPEHQKDVVKGTETLLKLLFFNDSYNVQKHIRISVFDAIMHWTDFLLAELVHVVQVDRVKEVQSLYAKVDNFFKKNWQSLRYDEETFERESNASLSTISSTSSIFNAGQQCLPDFDS